MPYSIPVLDKGLIEVQEIFGNDLTVVNAARVSFTKDSVEFNEEDAKLIKYLASHGHISPFFHPQIRLRLKMPIFVAREWYRHTVGFARNEISHNYDKSCPEFYIPRPREIRERDMKTPIEEAHQAWSIIKELNKSLDTIYLQLLNMKVDPELARTILPQGTYTEFIETASLYDYTRLCKLRLDPEIQKEFHDYITELDRLLRISFPVSWPCLVGPLKNVSVSC